MVKLINLQRSVIPACDVNTLDKLGQIAVATSGLPGIGAYKVGLELVLPFGLPRVVEEIKTRANLPVIYDHQKGATDIPALGVKFAKAVKSAAADAVILFPFGGAATEEAWIKACQDEGLVVLVGGHMTQDKFLEREEGFIADFGPERIYQIASDNEVTDFVVPGNKAPLVFKYRQLLENLLGEENFVLYAPGFIEQGGNIAEAGKAAGPNWHAIVGSAIYKVETVDDMRKAAIEITSQIAGE